MSDLATFVGPSIEWLSISPVLALLAGALLLLLVGSLTVEWKKHLYSLTAAMTSIVAIGLSVVLWFEVNNHGTKLLIGGALALDHFALLGSIAVCAAVLLVSLISSDYLSRDDRDMPEIYALYLTAAIGAMVMISSNDLIVLFLGLETLSLSLYLLTASNRQQPASQEAGLKYFILGGFASAFLLYGVALIYGVTGATRLTDLNAALASYISVPRNDVILLTGIGMILVGFGFKVSLAPFQMWTPDVYQGAPTPVTAFMASAGKLAAIISLMRVFVIAFPSRSDDWRVVVFVIAVLTLVVGSVVAIVQTNIKRMLAYSSISHAGFILVGLEAVSHSDSVNATDGLVAVGVYVALYAALVVGTFGVVTVVARDSSQGATSLDAFKGLAKNQPILGLVMTVFLLAQAGVPLTSGFVAKFGVIQSAVAVGSYQLAVVAMVCAVIAAFVYLRIIVSMWLSDGVCGEKVVVPMLSRIAIGVAVGVTLLIGCLPSLVLDITFNVAQLATK